MSGNVFAAEVKHNIDHVDIRIEKSILKITTTTTTTAEGQEPVVEVSEETKEIKVDKVKKVIINKKDGKTIELTKFTTRNDGDELEFDASINKMPKEDIESITFIIDYKDGEEVFTDLELTVGQDAIDGAYYLCPGVENLTKGLDFRFIINEDNKNEITKGDKPVVPPVVEEDKDAEIDIPLTGDYIMNGMLVSGVSIAGALIALNKKKRK